MVVYKANKLVVELLDPGIYRVTTPSGADIEMEDVQAAKEFFASHPEFKRAPGLIEAGKHSLGTAEVRKYLAGGERLFTADAVLINDSRHQLVYDMYLRKYSPDIPTRVFTDRQKAVSWLEQFLVSE